MKVFSICLAALLFCVFLSACNALTKGAEQSPPAITAEPSEAKAYRVLYLCNNAGTAELSVLTEKLKEKCVQEGIELVFIDCAGNDSVFLNTINELGKKDLDAVFATVSNENLGPLIQYKCNESGLPLICLESRLKDSDGREIAFVGENAYKGGILMGQVLARQAKARGFSDEKENTAVLMLQMTNLVSASEVMKGFRNQMENDLPELFSDKYSALEVIGASEEEQYLSLKNYFSKLDKNTNYIMAAFCDEGAYALATYANENALDPKHMLIGSVGGFEYSENLFLHMGNMRNSYFLVPVDYQQIVNVAVNMLLNKLKKNIELSEVQVFSDTVITGDNYQDYFQS